MDKKLSSIIFAIVIITLTACTTAQTLAAKPVLPTTIQDPILLEGWLALYNHQESIQMPDGSSLSGRELAQFIVDNDIHLQWIPKENDQQISFDKSSCIDSACEQKRQTIYFSPSILTHKPDPSSWLIESMAHEFYHAMLPFGPGRDTLFEEFSAYYISTRISQSHWANFKGYDGLDSDSLTKWFMDQNLIYGYADLGEYPKKVMPLVKAP